LNKGYTLTSIATPASTLDPYLSVGSEEELAGPPHAVAPVKRAERISSIDTLRGFALLGILILNIDDFGGPMFFHDIPPNPAFTGPHAHLNLIVLFIKWMFFEGKMRLLFSMLFGAGVLLLTDRAERRGAADKVADIYLRRNIWLVVLGVLHGTFIWDGDILLQYGSVALLFLYPCRKLKSKTLFTVGSLLILVVWTYGILQFTGVMQTLRLNSKAADVVTAQNAGHPLTPEQKKVEQQWKAMVKDHEVTKQKIDEEIAETHVSYLNHLINHGLSYEKSFASRSPFFTIAESVGAMLIGMGLYKTGFLLAELPFSTYLWTALLGFLVSIPIYILGIWKAYVSGFFFLTIDKWIYLPYPLTELAGGLAVAATLLIVIKSRIFHRLLRPIAAVGQTALTNYLLTSVLCQFVFLWGPWKLFGKLDYYQVNYVLLGVWAINLTLSTLWLRIFEFGPVEWLWRSATYWKLQPMLKKATY
jgi:uncharacterized protein